MQEPLLGSPGETLSKACKVCNTWLSSDGHHSSTIDDDCCNTQVRGISCVHHRAREVPWEIRETRSRHASILRNHTKKNSCGIESGFGFNRRREGYSGCFLGKQRVTKEREPPQSLGMVRSWVWGTGNPWVVADSLGREKIYCLPSLLSQISPLSSSPPLSFSLLFLLLSLLLSLLLVVCCGCCCCLLLVASQSSAECERHQRPPPRLLSLIHTQKMPI